MKILIIKDDNNLGKKGSVVDVSPGYARNYIFTNKIGVPATEAEINKFRNAKDKEEETKNKKNDLIAGLAKQLDGKELGFEVKVGKENEVFEGIHDKDVIEKFFNVISELDEGGLIEKDDVSVDMKIIKEIGEIEVPAYIGKGDNKKDIKLKINISAKK